MGIFSVEYNESSKIINIYIKLMKLLVDAHCFDYSTSEGVNTYLQGIYSELIKLKSDIEFYFVANDISKLQRIFGVHDNVVYVPLKSKNKIYRLLLEIPAIIRKYKIDFAHYQYTSPLIKNSKSIITLHDILFLDYPEYFPQSYKLSKGFLFWLSAKRADVLLTVSEYSKKQIAKHYGIPLSRISVTPNAVSEEYYSIDSSESKRYTLEQGVSKYILCLSRIESRKNHIALLKAFNELALWKQGYHLVFIGRKTIPVPEFDTYLESLSPEVRKMVLVINQVSYKELLLWYKSASLFVYPSLAEGFGIPPIEAGAAGIPCICSNQTAMADFSFFGENLIDPTNIEELKKCIISNLTNYSTERINKVKTEISQRYNWTRIATHFLEELNRQSVS